MKDRFEERHARLRPFVLCLCVLLAITVIEWGLYYGNGLFTRLHLPANFFPPMARPQQFTDFTNILPRVSHFGEPGMLARREIGMPFPYPLPSIFLFLPFVRATHHPLPAYLLVSFVLFAAAAALFARQLWSAVRSRKAQAIFWGTFLLFHPMWFLMDRGNIEVFLWTFTAAGLFCFARGRSPLAALLFAVPASMKIYPAVLFLLFVKRREWKALVLAIAATVVYTAATYQIVGPTIPQAVHDMQWSAGLMKRGIVNVLGRGVMRFDHSLFGLAKQVYYLFRRVVLHTGEQDLVFDGWTGPYSVAAVLGFLGLYLFRIRRLPLLNQVIALLLLAILLPFVSYDYTLIYVGIVFACLLLFSLERTEQAGSMISGRSGTVTAVLLAVTLSPLTNLAGRYCGGQVKCLALIGLLLLALRDPMPSRIFGDAPPAPPV